MLTNADPAGGVWRSNIDTCIRWVWVLLTRVTMPSKSREAGVRMHEFQNNRRGVAAYVTQLPVK